MLKVIQHKGILSFLTKEKHFKQIFGYLLLCYCTPCDTRDYVYQISEKVLRLKKFIAICIKFFVNCIIHITCYSCEIIRLDFLVNIYSSNKIKCQVLNIIDLHTQEHFVFCIYLVCIFYCINFIFVRIFVVSLHISFYNVWYLSYLFNIKCA